MHGRRVRERERSHLSGGVTAGTWEWDGVDQSGRSGSGYLGSGVFCVWRYDIPGWGGMSVFFSCGPDFFWVFFSLGFPPLRSLLIPFSSRLFPGVVVGGSYHTLNVE